MTPDFITTTRPCEEPHCVDGWNYDEDWWCQVCFGRAELEIEVHEACQLTEDECKCYDEVEEAKVA